VAAPVLLESRHWAERRSARSASFVVEKARLAGRLFDLDRQQHAPELVGVLLLERGVGSLEFLHEQHVHHPEAGFPQIRNAGRLPGHRRRGKQPNGKRHSQPQCDRSHRDRIPQHLCVPSSVFRT